MGHSHRPCWFEAALPAAVFFGIHLASGHAADRAVAFANDAASARVLVVYYSMTGNTEQMAKAVAEGVRRVAGVTVEVKQVQKVTKGDLQAADGIILGSPTYFANIPGTMKTYMDQWNWKWKVDFTDKVGGAFATGGGQMGGKEHTAVSLLLFMINNRMIVAGPLYQDETGEDQWAEIAAGAMTGPIDPRVGSAELDSARRLGERVASIVKRLQNATLLQRKKSSNERRTK